MAGNVIDARGRFRMLRGARLERLDDLVRHLRGDSQDDGVLVEILLKRAGRILARDGGRNCRRVLTDAEIDLLLAGDQLESVAAQTRPTEVWKIATHGEYWFVPEDADDAGEAERESQFPFFIYEVPMHEGDPESDEYKEPVGYAFVVRNSAQSNESTARLFNTFEEAKLGAEEWFKQTRPGAGQ